MTADESQGMGDHVPAPSQSLPGGGFAAFYELEVDRQTRRAVLFLGSREAAQDAVHDAFVAVFQRWEQLDEPGPYLERVVLNRCRDMGNAGPPTLVIDGTPVILVSGQVDESVLEQIASAVTISDPDTDFTISIGRPPTGFAFVVPPTVPTPVLSAAASNEDNTLDVTVNGEFPDPRFRPALSGETATATLIGDVIGWYSIGPTADDYTVAWEPRPGTIVVLTASHPGLSSDDVIELARNTRLTNEDEWRATYGVEDNPLPESPGPVVGQPVPTFDDVNRHTSPPTVHRATDHPMTRRDTTNQRRRSR